MSSLLLFAWGLCIFAAFLGYGRGMLQLLRVKGMPWPVAGSTGVAVVLLIGSILNIRAKLLPPALIAVILAGDVLFVAYFLRGLRSRAQRGSRADSFRNPASAALLICLAALLAVPVLSSLDAHPFSFAFDDWGGYLTLPVQTLQLGTLPADPFNERRVTTSLGASYVLQSFMLLAGGVQALRFTDVGIGFVLYAGALFAVFRIFRLPVRTSLVLSFVVILVPLSRPNLTMYVIPAALFLTLFLVQVHPALGEGLSWQRSVLLGLIAAAAACLKTNYLPAAALISGIYYLMLFAAERRFTVLAHGALFVAVMLVSLGPWMIDMRAKEETWLFPVLGRGYDASAYAVPLPGGIKSFIAPGAMSLWLVLIITAGPLLLAAIYILSLRRPAPIIYRPALLSFFLGTVVAVFVIAASTAGVSLARYSAPFQLPALFLLIGAIAYWRNEPDCRLWRFNGLAAIAALALISQAALFGIRDHEYLRLATEAGILHPVPPLGVPLNLEQERRRVAALQSAIPPNEPLLAHMFVTFPFDFKRNPIFSADFMGMAGVPPGMPFEQRPEALRRYLLAQHIRFVAYDPERTVPSIAVPEDDVGSIIAHPAAYGRLSWVIIQTKVSQNEESNIAALAPHYRHVYDDGHVYLLDLLQRE